MQKAGRVPEPTYVKSGSDFKEFSKAIDHVGSVLLPEWRSTIRLGGHTFKKMKQLGESSGQVVPEIAFMEKWARERQQTPEQKNVFKVEPADSDRTSAGSSSSAPSSSSPPTSSHSPKSSSPEKPEKLEETGGRGSCLSSDVISLTSLSSDQSSSSLFPSLSVCFREMKERKIETDDMGGIFEILDDALRKDMDEKSGKMGAAEMGREGRKKIFRFIETLRAGKSDTGGEDEVQILYQKKTMVSGVASQVLNLKPQVLKDFLDEKFYDVVHHQWEGAELLPNRKMLWEWAKICVKGPDPNQPLKGAHLVELCTQLDICELFLKIQEFFQPLNFAASAKKLGDFYSCVSQRGETLQNFFDRLDKIVKEVEQVRPGAVTQVQVVEKMISAIGRDQNFKIYFETNITMNQEKWLAKTPEEIRSEVSIHEASQNSFSLPQGHPQANFMGPRNFQRRGEGYRDRGDRERGPPNPSENTDICFSYQRTGKCGRQRRGRECAYRHPKNFQNPGKQKNFQSPPYQQRERASSNVQDQIPRGPSQDRSESRGRAPGRDEKGGQRSSSLPPRVPSQDLIFKRHVSESPKPAPQSQGSNNGGGWE
jgi:hypothetical protein